MSDPRAWGLDPPSAAEALGFAFVLEFPRAFEFGETLDEAEPSSLFLWPELPSEPLEGVRFRRSDTNPPRLPVARIVSGTRVPRDVPVPGGVGELG